MLNVFRPFKTSAVSTVLLKQCRPFLRRGITAAVLLAIALGGGGCASVPPIHSISIDPTTHKPPKISYSDRASQSVGEAGVMAGALLPMLVAGAIKRGMEAAPRKQLVTAAASHQILIDQIVRDAFTQSIQHSGILTLGEHGATDATLEIDIRRYGVDHQGEAMAKGQSAPTIWVDADVWTAKNKRIYTCRRPFVADQKFWGAPEDFAARPEFLRAGLESAANAAAQRMIAAVREQQAGH